MKRGFTLIELLVYMAIMGFIIVVAGKVFSDSTSMRVRSQNMVKSAEIFGKVSDLLREDISQMGIKAWGENAPSVDVKYSVGVEDEVYWNKVAGDYSSYALERKVDGDKLTFKKADFNENGEFLSVREITWEVIGGNLFRKCITVGSCGAGDEECGICPDNDESEPVLIAENVRKFVLNPSKPGTENGSDEDKLFPVPEGNTGYNAAHGEKFSLLARNADGDAKPISPLEYSSEEISINFFIQNSAQNNEAFYNQVFLATPDKTIGDSWNSECYEMAFIKGETYAVEFKMPFLKSGDWELDTNSTQFLPGMDHIAVGLRSKTGNPLNPPDGVSPDVLFYPPQDNMAEGISRYAEFSIHGDQAVNACVALTFAFYSPKANSGKIRFRNFTVTRKADRAFYFPKNIADYGTESMVSGGGGGGANDDSEKIKAKNRVKAFELEMEIENKGEIASTQSSENSGMIISTPNNGVQAEGSN
jgi:prepilin-type N-terminal cleavage/methylation domain-containing protein